MPLKRSFSRTTKITRRKRLRRPAPQRFSYYNTRAALTNTRMFTTSRVCTTGWQVDAKNEHDYKIIQFSLDYLDNYTEYTSLWNQYRINYVDLTFMFNRPMAMLGDPQWLSLQMPTLVHAADTNDVGIPNYAELVQIPNVRFDRLDKVVRRRIYPRAAIAAYSGAFTSYADAGKLWVDTASPAVRYYGLKADVNCPIPNGTTMLLGCITVIMRYNMSFRNPK